MPSTDPANTPYNHSRADLLSRVKRRGRRLRRRRQAGQTLTGLAVVAVTALLVPQIIADDSEQRVTTASPTTTDAETPTSWVTTTTERDSATATASTTTTPDASVAPPPPATTVPPPARATSTTTATPSTTTVPPACRNSRDEACGPYYWDPPPDRNRPLLVEVTFTPTQPQPGDEVTFRVTVSDPDATIERQCNVGAAYGDGSHQGGCVSSASCAARYGAWTPPEPVPDRHETSFTHRYDDVGDFTAVFTFESRSGACYDDPYGSSGEGQVTVPVRSGT